MFYRFSLLTLLIPFTLMEASCIPQKQTESKQGVVYALGSTTPYEGCIVEAYSDGQKKSELFYHKGKQTGEGRLWYENGPKQSEVIYKSGKIYTKKLWNMMGYLYSFERYKEGKRLYPVEMAYKQAIEACQKATFHGHGGWRLPSVEELYEVPFSEASKEMTFMASNPLKKVKNTQRVSYVRFGGTPESARWNEDDLDINSALNVICISEGNPLEFHLVMGLNGTADLTSKYRDGNVRVKAAKHTSVAEKNDVKQKTLRSGYYISIYTFSTQPPEKAQLDAILKTGYRYRFNESIKDEEKITNVLVGPFPTEEKANKELKRVHLKIKPDAYIIDNIY